MEPVPCRALEKAEREAAAKEKEERFRKERSNRDAFRDLLQEHVKDGTIHAKLRWKVRPGTFCPGTQLRGRGAQAHGG